MRDTKICQMARPIHEVDGYIDKPSRVTARYESGSALLTQLYVSRDRMLGHVFQLTASSLVRLRPLRRQRKVQTTRFQRSRGSLSDPVGRNPRGG